MINFPNESVRLDFHSPGGVHWNDPGGGPWPDENGKEWVWNESKKRWEPHLSVAASFAELTDKATADLPGINGPLQTALDLKADAADLGTAAAADLLDDNTLGGESSSATAVPSQQSVKAYVDANSGTVDNSSVVTALGGTPADSVTLSMTGGENKIPQYNSDADLVTGPWDNDNALGPGGQVLIPRRRYLGFLDNSGNIGAGMYFWPGHSGGDEIVASSPRWAWYWSDGWQMGNPATAPAGTRDNRHIYIQPYQATDASADTRILESPPVQFTARYWDGAASADQNVGMQLVPKSQAANTENLVMRFGASISSMRLTGGTEVFSLTRDGLWHPGLNSDFDELTDAATVSYPINRNKTRQNAYVVIAGARTLEFSGALEAGMRGTLRVEQGSGGNHTLALPANAKVANNGLGAVTLSTAEGAVDLLRWEYDGTWTYWDILKDYTKALDANVQAFLTATSIADQTQIDAISQLVLDLKNAALWNNFAAIYPFVGGTSGTHAVNLKSPGTYDITWASSPTHDAGGVTGDGAATANGDTGINFSVLGGYQNDFVAYVLVRAPVTPTASGYFFFNDDGTYRNALFPTGSTNIGARGPMSGSTTALVYAVGSSDFRKSLFLGRSASDLSYIDRNGITNTNTHASTGVPNTTMKLLQSTNAQLGFAAFGHDIDQTQRNTFRSIVDAFQTAIRP